MEFIVHDTFSAMAGLLERPLEDRPALLSEMLSPMRAAIPMPGDIVDIHHMGAGFRVDREDARYLPAVRNLIDRDVKGQIERTLAEAADTLSAFNGPDSLNVMFVLGDPDDDYLMNVAGGYYGMGSYGDWLYVIAWPREDVIDRIAYCAVHEFHHNVRYRNVEWNPATVTVGEHVVSEGLAEAFVRELSGPEAMGPWSAFPLADEVFDKIVADLDLQGMANTPAYVLGDTAVSRFGQEPRGISDMAGYAAGLRLVEAHLEATGMSVAECTALPAEEILKAWRATHPA
ncbi:DUF2268 domain-containing protein [Nonomuraea africana]|uniref:Uncharacterized protein YjaZ n=1 Tax=Nonomuraea africana TaxID=46171 RepID=A0ABR9KFY8_9ACTN|nr:DUF2268 domain-containing putative Zn-dependent protease [Nonomuraea africana]MBE1560563.1 uncharacterized protein YjaZ [Nonomuraea africana]